MIIDTTTRAAPRARSAVAAPTERRREPARLACLIILGIGAGISPFWGAYYAPGIWIPIGLALVILAAAFAVARPPNIRLPAALVLVGLTGLALWALLSAVWAHAADPTTSLGNLLLLYVAFLIVAMVLVEEPRHAAILLGAAAAGVLIVALSVVVRMLGTDASSLFVLRRLNSPMGYINGEGCLFAMGIWLGVGVAERREPLLAGAGAAAAVVFACLTVLSQSRGAAIATIAAIVVLLAVIPGFRRRTLAMLVVGLGVTAAGSRLLDLYSHGQATAPARGTVHSVALAIIVAAAAVGLVWGVLVAGYNMLGGRSEAVARRGRVAATAVVVLALIAIPVAGLVRLGPIERTVSRQWHAFTHLSHASNANGANGVATQTRLLSGAGNRYDFWRVAWKVWRKDPLIGVGAGNYTASYVLARRTDEYVQNPHSLELQALSELGVVGGVLLALAVAGVMLGVWRMRARAFRSRLTRTLMVAATGAAVAWFTDTSGDWMHLVPGITAVALIAITVITRAAPGPASRRGHEFLPSRRRLRAGMVVALGLTLAIGGASLLRQGAVTVFVDRAQARIVPNPRSAASEANRALGVDASNLSAYYAKAAALARLDRPAAAQNALLDAARADPTDFVTWTLLGDLAVRTRDFGLARVFYGRAHALNPRDPELARAAAQPPTASG